MIDVLTAAEMAIAEARRHHLPIGSIEVAPGSTTAKRWSAATRDFTRPVLPKVTLCVFSQPAAFLAWAEHLDVERVHVERRALDTCLHADVDLYGLTWSINSSLSRPKQGPHLPGITVDWPRRPSGRARDEAWIPLSDLRTTLTALGVVEEVAS